MKFVLLRRDLEVKNLQDRITTDAEENSRIDERFSGSHPWYKIVGDDVPE